MSRTIRTSSAPSERLAASPRRRWRRMARPAGAAMATELARVQRPADADGRACRLHAIQFRAMRHRGVRTQACPAAWSAGRSGPYAYARRGAGALSAGRSANCGRARDRRGACRRAARIWVVTETGAGAPHAGAGPTDPGGRRAGQAAARSTSRCCAGMPIRAWTMMFKYTFREDTLFPVGLADAALTRLYPAYYLWLAWGGARQASAPPPPLPVQCA